MNMPVFARVVIGVLLAIFLCLGGALLVLTLNRPPAQVAPSPLEQPRHMQGIGLPEFALVDQDNRPQTRAGLIDGNVTIAGFVFSRCPLACPGMMLQMSKLSESLRDTTVRLASFSLDPEYDGPEQLAEFAKRFGAESARWRLLTEPRGGTITQVSRRMLGENLREHILQDDATKITVSTGEMSNIEHPPHLFLLGPRGEVLGRYNSTRPEEMEALTAHARAASIANKP
jgi:protein SCO1